MAEYIEREALLNEARKRAKAFSSVLIYEAIKEAPTADVVEVVRCKDCIYAHMTISKEEVKYCDMFDSDDGVYFDKNHFCSYGERKEVANSG